MNARLIRVYIDDRMLNIVKIRLSHSRNLIIFYIKRMYKLIKHIVPLRITKLITVVVVVVE